jgi:hypothetical protein
MKNTGPILEVLTHRLAETPIEFLAEPAIGGSAGVAVAALVNDLLYRQGARAPIEVLRRFDGQSAALDRNRLAVVMITTWLMAHEWFVAAKPAQADVVALLSDALSELAAATPAHKFVSDPDRREELARIVLARLDYRPADESLAQASDRLSSISGSERRRLLAASRAAEERARDIRAALARKAAEESADKWTRE